MAKKGITTIYQRTVRQEFPTSAILFPVTQKLKLGDYGYFYNGKFMVEDNILERLKLNIDDFIAQKLEDSPVASYLIISENATILGINSAASGAGKFKVSMSISFGSKNGCVIQLYRCRSENLYLKRELDAKVAELYSENEWKERYRMVWQRRVAEELNFAYSLQKGAQITIGGEADSQNIKIGEVQLGIDFQKTKNMNASLWVDSGEVTPTVSLARYSKKESDFVVEKSFDYGLCTRDKKPFEVFEEPRLIIDNSGSFADLDDIEDNNDLS